MKSKNKVVTNIHLKPKLKLSPSKNIFDKLINLLALNVWGDYFISESIRKEMRAVSVLMVIIFIFDLLAWTMLFNLIFNSGHFQVSNFTILAMALAFLLSVVTIIFERNIFITDTTEDKIKVWLLNGFRIFIVSMTAVITAQPIHMMIFKDTIMERHQEEQIIAYSVATSTKLNERINEQEETKKKLTVIDEKDIFKQASNRALGSPRVKQLDEDVISAQKKIDDFDEKNAEAKKALSKIKSEIKIAEEELKTLKGGLYWIRSPKNKKLDDDERSKKEKYQRRKISKQKTKIKALNIELEAAKENAKGYLKERARLETALKVVKLSRAEVIEEITKREREILLKKSNKKSLELKVEREKLRHEINQQRDFVAFLKGEKLGAGESRDKRTKPITVTIEGEEYTIGDDGTLSFTLEEIGFSKQRRIFVDIEDGREPMWPIVQLSKAEREMLAEHFKIQRLPDLSNPNSPEALAWKYDRKRLKKNGDLLWQESAAAYFIGVFIPLMVILFKLFMPKELKEYYSARYQAKRGHPEAMRFIEACGGLNYDPASTDKNNSIIS